MLVLAQRFLSARGAAGDGRWMLDDGDSRPDRASSAPFGSAFDFIFSQRRALAGGGTRSGASARSGTASRRRSRSAPAFALSIAVALPVGVWLGTAAGRVARGGDR